LSPATKGLLLSYIDQEKRRTNPSKGGRSEL
jgi:hypothetical protein